MLPESRVKEENINMLLDKTTTLVHQLHSQFLSHNYDENTLEANTTLQDINKSSSSNDGSNLGCNKEIKIINNSSSVHGDNEKEKEENRFKEDAICSIDHLRETINMLSQHMCNSTLEECIEYAQGKHSPLPSNSAEVKHWLICNNESEVIKSDSSSYFINNFIHSNNKDANEYKELIEQSIAYYWS